MKDATGRELEISQVVDCYAEGMLSAVVLRIEEGGLIGEDGRPRPALLIVQVGIPFQAAPGEPMPVYIVKPADMRRLGGPQEKTKKGRLN